MEGDELLEHCNETELQWIAKRQGLSRLRRGIPHAELVAIVKGELPVMEQHLSSSNKTRKTLAVYIHNPAVYAPDPKYQGHWERVMSQLPGCNGLCDRFDCSDLRHYDCVAPNEDKVT